MSAITLSITPLLAAANQQILADVGIDQTGDDVSATLMKIDCSNYEKGGFPSADAAKKTVMRLAKRLVVRDQRLLAGCRGWEKLMRLTQCGGEFKNMPRITLYFVIFKFALWCDAWISSNPSMPRPGLERLSPLKGSLFVQVLPSTPSFCLILKQVYSQDLASAKRKDLKTCERLIVPRITRKTVLNFKAKDFSR
ncbi:hypothetical protein B0H19DRAFT_1068324 [Mycena capillaripes]|nr:hypothetical protein B0H19DRAFT_1068324 [Mycena capillaripes]